MKKRIKIDILPKSKMADLKGGIIDESPDPSGCFCCVCSADTAGGGGSWTATQKANHNLTD
jgi:hypothetical protein